MRHKGKKVVKYFVSKSTSDIEQVRKHFVYITLFPVIALVLATSVFFGSLKGNDAGAAPLAFLGNYEGGNLNQWDNCQFVNYNNPCSSAPSTYSIKAQSTVKRYGNYAARFELRDGDTQAGTNERDEVAKFGIGAASGNDMWYAQSILFDATFPSTHSWGLISQFKANGGSSPPLGLYVDHGTNLWGLTINNYSNSSSFNTNPVWSTAMTRNVWHDIKLHIKWSADDSVGFVELYYNGVKQTFKGACAGQTKCVMSTMIPGVSGENYYKQGYYRCACVSGTGIVYHDEFRVAYAEADLGAPFNGGATTPPTPPTPPTPTTPPTPSTPPTPPTPPTPTTPPTTPTPPSATQTPYGGAPHSIPGKIEAEDFDDGGEGVAYHDTTTTNDGAKYRTTGVDIQSSTDGGYNVGWNPPGEWREHTVNTQAGTYTVTARVSSALAGGQLLVKLDGQTLGTLTVPNTAGWQSYQTVTLNNVSIPAGNNKVLRFETAGNDYTINWVNFALNGSTAPPPTPTPPPPTPTPTPTNNPSVPEVVVTRPQESVPLVVIPGSNGTNAVQIPKDVMSNSNGQLIGDFNGDGLNDIAFDLNSDGSINPGDEIVVNGSDEPMLTDKNVDPFYADSGEYDEGMNYSSKYITINSGPFRGVHIPKFAAYTFLVAQISALIGLIIYFVVRRSSRFSDLRSRLGL